MELELGLVQLGAVHFCEDLPGGDDVADFHVELLDAPGGLRGDVVDHVGQDGGRVERGLRYALLCHGHYAHDRERFLLCGLCAVAAILLSAACEQHGGG